MCLGVSFILANSKINFLTSHGNTFTQANDYICFVSDLKKCKFLSFYPHVFYNWVFQSLGAHHVDDPFSLKTQWLSVVWVYHIQFIHLPLPLWFHVFLAWIWFRRSWGCRNLLLISKKEVIHWRRVTQNSWLKGLKFGAYFIQNCWHFLSSLTNYKETEQASVCALYIRRAGWQLIFQIQERVKSEPGNTPSNSPPSAFFSDIMMLSASTSTCSRCLAVQEQSRVNSVLGK